MFKSKARETIEAALVAATEPADQARLAAELNSLLATEERRKERNRRKKNKAVVRKAAESPRVDPNEEFVLDVERATATPSDPVAEEERRLEAVQSMVEFGVLPPQPGKPEESPVAPIVVAPHNGSGTTRTLHAMAPP